MEEKSVANVLLLNRPGGIDVILQPLKVLLKSVIFVQLSKSPDKIVVRDEQLSNMAVAEVNPVILSKGLTIDFNLLLLKRILLAYPTIDISYVPALEYT